MNALKYGHTPPKKVEIVKGVHNRTESAKKKKNRKKKKIICIYTFCFKPLYTERENNNCTRDGY